MNNENENQTQNPSKIFRPHVKDIHAANKASQENNVGGIIGVLATAAFSGMAVCCAGAHLTQGMAAQAAKAPMNTPPTTPPTPGADISQARVNIDTKGFKSGMRTVGRNAMQHADEIEQFYENNKKEDRAPDQDAALAQAIEARKDKDY